METEKKAKSNIFPTKDAKIIVLLSDHAGKVWYSSSSDFDKIPDSFSPFFLPANPDLGHRSVVKLYFLEKYGIVVSVRPAFLKEFVEDVPYVFYRARVQTGDATRFLEFTKMEQEHWLREFRNCHKIKTPSS